MVKASCPYLYLRQARVGFAPDGQVSVVFAVASPALAAQLVAAVVVRAGPVVAAPADPAHVSSAVEAAADLHVVLVGFAPVLIHDASVVAAAVAE